MELAVVDAAYVGLEPLELWRHFSALNRIPRPPRHEAQAARYVRDVAEAAGATWDADDAGNTVVRVPPTGPNAGGVTVAVQAHLDMVCDSEPGISYDPELDPIVPRRDGVNIVAKGTTLGADNGVGAAAALALLTTPGLAHGPLELVFTVEEETGLQGALAFNSSLLESRLLLNLDGEDHRTVVVGSIGTQDISVSLPSAPAAVSPSEARAVDVAVIGLKGGHSGMAIAQEHANALKVMADVVRALESSGLSIELARLSGGTARNAIPRVARSTLVVPADTEEALHSAIEEISRDMSRLWRATEPDLRITAERVGAPGEVLEARAAERVIALLERAPHGVLAMSRSTARNVRTSSNLALADVSPSAAHLLVTSRSHVAADQDDIARELGALADELHGEAVVVSGYPPWTADVSEGSLVALTATTYEKLKGHPPSLEVIDGGLECGVIAAAIPGMQAVSFGPLIADVHTPRERLDSSTVPPFWALLVELLSTLRSRGSHGSVARS